MPLFSFAEILNACGGEFVNVSDFHISVDSVSTDSREKTKNGLFIALSGENFDGHDYLRQAIANGAVLLCIEKAKLAKLPPGVPAILVNSPLRAYQELAHLYRRRFKNLKVIALTGSCGKTSTKETLYAIFAQVYGAEHVLATQGNTNNQIGVPQNMMRLTPEYKVCILEMGTNHFGEIEPIAGIAEPDVSLVVSIGSCHLEYLKNLDGVATEKSHILLALSKDGTAVIPQESPGNGILRSAASKAGRILTFGYSEKSTVQVIYKGGNISGSSFELINHENGERALVNWSLSGRHQACNAAGAAAVAVAFGIPLAQIAGGIRQTRLPGMRMRLAEHGGATWLNDAYNANPDSMRASLEWLSEFADEDRLLLVLGDMGEIGKSALKEHLKVLYYARRKFPEARIAAVGTHMSKAVAVMNLVSRKNILPFPVTEEAVAPIRRMVGKGDLVFLKASRRTGLEVIEPED